MYNIQLADGTEGRIFSELSEITLREYIEYMRDIESTMPKVMLDYKKEMEYLQEEFHKHRKLQSNNKRSDDYIWDKKVSKTLLREIEQRMYEPDNEKDILLYKARVVSYWSGIDYDVLIGATDGPGLQISDLTTLYNYIMGGLSPQETKYTNVLEHGNELWYLPAEFMKDGEVIEYLESSEFQEQARSLTEDKQWEAMARIMCVLVKKEGEKWSSELMEREQMFLDWPMDKVYSVAFFLQTRLKNSLETLKTFTKALKVARLRKVLKSLTNSTDDT